jgi:hypothetical protein
MAPGSQGQVNAGGWHTVYNGVVSPFDVPLGAYAGVTSPWGLYDCAGGTAEWTESLYTLTTGNIYRIIDGSWWLDGSVNSDTVPGFGAFVPDVGSFDHGLRIASAVPAPASVVLLAYPMLAWYRRRRVHHPHATNRGPCTEGLP